MREGPIADFLPGTLLVASVNDEVMLMDIAKGHHCGLDAVGATILDERGYA